MRALCLFLSLIVLSFAAPEAAAQKDPLDISCRGQGASGAFEIGIVVDIAGDFTVVMMDMTTGAELAGSRRTINSMTDDYGTACQYRAYAGGISGNDPAPVAYQTDRLYRLDIVSLADPAQSGSYYTSFIDQCAPGSSVFCPQQRTGYDTVIFLTPDGPKLYPEALPGPYGGGMPVESYFSDGRFVLPYDFRAFCSGPVCPTIGNYTFWAPAPLPGTGPAMLPITLDAATGADWRVPAGATWNWSAADVSAIRFGAGGHVTVNGTLNTTTASGTTTTPGVALAAANVTDGWGGIQFNAGSGGTLFRSEITGVKTYGGAAVSITGASPMLRDVRIANSPCCGTDGIYVSGSASNPTIQRVTIEQMSGTGVTLDNSAQARLIRNIIRNNGEDGVVAGYGTSPFLSPDAPNNERTGNDILTNVGNGVYAGSQAYATYGWYYYGGAGYAHADGYNDILGNGLAGNRVVLGGAIAGGGSNANRRNGYYDNVSNETEAVGSGSRAYVSCNYWGPGATPPFQTAATGGGTVTLLTYLTQNPRSNPTEPCQSLSTGGELGKQASASSASRGAEDDLAAVLEEAAGLAMLRPAEALGLLRAVVAQGDDALAAAALAEAGRIASGPQALPAARAFLSEHAAGVSPRRRGAALRSLVGVRHAAGDAAGALAAATALAASADAADAASGSLASVYLLSEAGATDAALAALTAVERLLPQSREAAMARRHLGLAPTAGRGTAGNETGESVAAAKTEAVGGADLLPARPNPVGHTATVPFRLAHSAQVRLSVVDVLGREVAVLADGTFEGGDHVATLDASRLAPGVYVVQFTARSDDGAAERRSGRVTVAR